MKLFEFVAVATNLPKEQVGLLPPHELALAVGSVVAEGEISDAVRLQEAVRRSDLRHKELEELERLPAYLTSPKILAGLYLEMVSRIPAKFRQIMNRLDGVDRSRALDALAKVFVNEHFDGTLDYSERAGVKVDVLHNNQYQARTLTGFTAPIQPQTGAVVELGPGLAGGTRRIEEARDSLWSGGVWLLNHVSPLSPVSFPDTYADALAERYHLDRAARYVTSKGVGAGMDILRQSGTQADLVIATQIGSTPDVGEALKAVAAVPDVLVRGGKLVVSDFTHHPHAAAIMDAAAERFGQEPEIHEAPMPGREMFSLRSAAFTR